MGPSGTDTLRLLAAASPVLVIAVLVIFLNMSALGLSLWGLLLTSIVAATLFHTSVMTILLGALDGVITTLPLLLIVFFGIMLSVLLIRTGALPRVVNGLSGRFRHPMHQVSAICFGIENFVAGAGIIAEPIIAPTLKTIGLPAKSAAILAIWGYAGIMSFSIAGAFLLILSLVTGLDLHKLAVTAAVISLVPTLMCGILLPLVVGKRGLAKGHILFNACVGLACAGLVLVFVVYTSSSAACMLAGIAVLAGTLFLCRAAPGLKAFRLADLAPFLILIACLTAVNMYPPLRSLAGQRLVFSVSVLPAHVVTIRPLMDAYTYLVVAIAVSLWAFKIGLGEFCEIVRTTANSSLKAVSAMMIFGAMGQIIAFTGYGSTGGSFSRADNIPYVLASGLSNMSGSFYPIFAPVLGWIGTFLTGYGALSIMIFGRLQVEIAQFLHVSPEVLSAAMMVGSGIGSISSPFKMAIAASLVGAVGKEGEILRKTIPLGIAISLVTGVWTYLVMHFR
jgi:lactate permease